MRRILELNHSEARAFFLKEESYVNFDLPQYFTFQGLLDELSERISGSRLKDFLNRHPPDEQGASKPTYPSDYECVNYKFLNNKDGKFSRRPFQLIHPAIYVSLVHSITEEGNWNLLLERFKAFSLNKRIRCYSIPLMSDGSQSDKATTISEWWRAVEQQSIELALAYQYVLHTDIADCYSSIYTHSIPWAIHTKKVAKERRRDHSLIGNVIDKHLQDMAFGQTNGIPQGSVLMDFLAEMVLGYADLELSERIGETIQDYQIIRYRDDYRIFSNNPQAADLIAKILTEILIELGMRLNSHKTIVSDNVVRDSIKPDKLYWIAAKRGAKNIQEHLLLIHRLSEEFQNSGSVTKALTKFYKRIKGIKDSKHNIKVLISILIDIMCKNPRTYPIASAILSKFLSLLQTDVEMEDILESIYKKFEKIPNTGHVKIWLQRLTIKIDRDRVYEEDLCKKVNDGTVQIWNSVWLNETLKKLVDAAAIVSEQTIQEIDVVIEEKEVDLFKMEYDYVEVLTLTPE